MLMNTSVNTLKHVSVTTQLEANAVIEATNKQLLALTDMVEMDPYEAKALTRFNATVFLNGLLAKADPLIPT